MKKILLALAILFISLNLRAQERRETIYKNISPEKKGFSTLWIDNISGDIQVETHESDFILLEIKKFIKAENEKKLKTGWDKIDPVILQTNDTVEIYLKGFCERDCDKTDGHYWHRCNADNHPYEFQFDFTVKVPADVNLRLSTVNNGDINIIGSTGKLKVNNVNGGISLEKITGTTEAKTINGDVTISYSKNPEGNSKYYTLNGTLTVYYNSDLSADLTFKSYNGDFYTDFEISKYHPSILMANKDDNNGTSWKIENRNSIRIGKGGISLDLETFNGDIYVRNRE